MLFGGIENEKNGFKVVFSLQNRKQCTQPPNQIGPECVRRESTGAETLCARSHAPGQCFDQNFKFRGVENRVKTLIFIIFWKTLRGGFFHIILCLRGSLRYAVLGDDPEHLRCDITLLPF